MLRKLFIIVLLGCVVGASGCAVKRDYAQVRRNFEVEKVFRQGEILPGYRYYYNGPDAEPIALLALQRKYELKSLFWHEFESEAQLQGWIRDLDRIAGHFDDIEYLTIDYKGLEIVSNDNRQIGVAYTRYDWIIAWHGEGNEMYVSRPEPGGNQRSPMMFRRYRDDW